MSATFVAASRAQLCSIFLLMVTKRVSHLSRSLLCMELLKADYNFFIRGQVLHPNGGTVIA